MNILYPEISYLITGLCFKVHNSLGRFCKEKQYSDKLEELFIKNGIPYKRECKLQTLDENSPKGNQVDFLVFDKVILEIKAKNRTTRDDYFQTQRYLHALNVELGLIINFRKYHLSPKRIMKTNKTIHVN